MRLASPLPTSSSKTGSGTSIRSSSSGSFLGSRRPVGLAFWLLVGGAWRHQREVIGIGRLFGLRQRACERVELAEFCGELELELRRVDALGLRDEDAPF